jgi:LacI family transcriptional regulator
MASARRRRVAQPGRTTLADVARAAGVSIASASRSFSRPDLVSEALCARVTTAAADLAYTPGGFGLTSDRRPCVGAVLARLNDGFTGAVVEALARELARSNMLLIAAVTDGTPEATAARIAELLARGSSAIAFCGAPVPAVPKARVPFVSLDGGGAPDARWAPVFSRAQALALGALYLGGLGHVRVALLDVPDRATVESVKERAATRGVEVVKVETELVGGPTLGEMMAKWPSRVTGVVCGSDRAAAALLRSCEHVQIAVPAELAVIGFGDSELSRQVRPVLTSLRVAPAEAGVALAHRLLDAIAGRASNTAPLGAKLVARESTAPAARSPDV